MFRISYKITVFSSLNLAGRGLAGRGYGPGIGLTLVGRAGPGTNIHGLGRAWAGPGHKF